MRLSFRRPPNRGLCLFTDLWVAPLLLVTLLAFAASSLSAQIRVMTNGDSITYGVGASDPATRCYTADLAGLLGSAYTVQKDGTGGATMLKKGQPSFWNTQGILNTTNMNPNIIYIMLGTNDSKSGNWIYKDEFVGDYVSLIDLYNGLSAKPQIYIGLPPPAQASAGDVDGPTIANQVIPRILEVARQRNVKVVDVHTPFVASFPSLLADGIHPNDQGHMLIATTLRDAILYGRVWRAVPAPWSRVDVGLIGYAGADAIDDTDAYQVLGGGAAINGTADAFRFVNQPASGDVDVSARVLGQRNVDPLMATRADSAAGVMIRESADAGARHFSVIATPGNGVSIRWRDAVGLSGGSAVVTGVTPPVWVRVRRSGNSFTGYYSTNGSSWVQLGSARTIAMASASSVGLAANSAQSNTLTHARFDQVKVVLGASAAPDSTTSNPTTNPPTTTTPTVSTVTGAFDPSASTGRTLVNNAYAALFDPLNSAWSFATDQTAIRPLCVAFPGTTRDSLSFDGTRVLPGPRAQDLFAPDTAQDAGFVAAVRIPASGGSGQANILCVNKSDTEPALALGYDYGMGRFYATYLQSVNGASSQIAGATSARGASYVVRLQKTGGTVRLYVDGVMVAESTTARPSILVSSQGGPLGLGGIRPLNPQFVGQIGKFYLRNGALSDSDAATMETDLRAWVVNSTSTPTTPTTGGSGTDTTTTTPSTDTSSATAAYDPSSSTSRTLANDAYAALFDPTRSTWSFATDQSAIRPTRVAFPGTSRDSLSFDGARMLPGPKAQDLFAPGVAQDLGFAAVVRIPASGGSGKALIFTVNRSDTESAVALGYDYGMGRFYVVFNQASNGAPSEIAGAASVRGASYVVRLQKAAGTVRLYVDGVKVAETTTARTAVLASGQGGPLGLGGLRPLNPQFVGQVGKFYFRNATLSDTDAAAMESDLRTWVGTTTTTPPPTTSTPTSTVAATGAFDPSSGSARTLVNDAYAALFDPARSTWSFATDQSAIRPTRVAFPGTSRDSMSFDGARMLPGPKAQDLFTPGVSQDAGVVAALRIPSTGGGGKAVIFTINKSDTEPALALGYDYGMSRFYVVYLHSFNGAPVELAGAASPRGASYVVRLQKASGLVRLWVNGTLVAESTAARGSLLATGEGAPMGLGGIRPLNPQFVGQIGKFYLRNGTLTDAEAATLETDLRTWGGTN